MLAEVDLVSSGSVVGARPADSIDPSGVRNVRTLFKVTATEVFRNISSQVVDDAIEVARSVGERDRGAYIERVIQDGFPSFEIGRNYLMFLKWSNAQNAWVPAFGPDSVLDLTDGIANLLAKPKSLRPSRASKQPNCWRPSGAAVSEHSGPGWNHPHTKPESRHAPCLSISHSCPDLGSCLRSPRWDWMRDNAVRASQRSSRLPLALSHFDLNLPCRRRSMMISLRRRMIGTMHLLSLPRASDWRRRPVAFRSVGTNHCATPRGVKQEHRYRQVHGNLPDAVFASPGFTGPIAAP